MSKTDAQQRRSAKRHKTGKNTQSILFDSIGHTLGADLKFITQSNIICQTKIK